MKAPATVPVALIVVRTRMARPLTPPLWWLAAFVFTLLTGATAYPSFRQCDPLWGADEMGTPGAGERSTICGEGCAMTCLAMVLAGWGVVRVGPVSADPKTFDPKTLNVWLEANAGYTCASGDCNNLVLDAPSRINASVVLVGELPPPPPSDIAAGLASGRTAYLAHVVALHHFVLLTGLAPGSAPTDGRYTVLDPLYNATEYGWRAFGDIIMYTLAAAQ